MRHLTYFAVLAACLLGTAPLEVALHTGVYARWRRVLLALLPGAVAGIVWDAYAVHAHQWTFDRRYVIGVRLASLPIEEWLFFLVIPVAAILTLEAVRRRRPRWWIGDEPGSQREPQPKSAP